MQAWVAFCLVLLPFAEALRGSSRHSAEVYRENLLFARSYHSPQAHGKLRRAHKHKHKDGLLAIEGGKRGGSEEGIIHKTEYWGKITLGTPPQEFTVIFDSGSGNLIIPGSDCEASACNAHRKYQPSSSTSSVAVGKSGKPLDLNPNEKKDATVKFGTGEIHGHFFGEKLCLGGTGSTACTNANFIATDQETEEPFISCQFDGIMGLGFKDLSMGEGFNIIDDLVAQHSLPRNQFSVYLTDTGHSEINFGGYKEEQAASDVLWVPVNKQSYWQIAIDDIAFNNKKQNLCSGCQVAVDTGTSLLAGPSDVISKLGDSLGVKDDCSNFDSLPMLGFAVGDRVLNLKPDDYMDRGEDGCSVALMTLDVPPPRGPLFVFGDPFLRRFLTIYDRDGPSVGFAVAKQDDLKDEEAKNLIATVVGASPQASLAKPEEVPAVVTRPSSSSEEALAAETRPSSSSSPSTDSDGLDFEATLKAAAAQGMAEAGSMDKTVTPETNSAHVTKSGAATNDGDLFKAIATASYPQPSLGATSSSDDGIFDAMESHDPLMAPEQAKSTEQRAAEAEAETGQAAKTEAPAVSSESATLDKMDALMNDWGISDDKPATQGKTGLVQVPKPPLVSISLQRTPQTATPGRTGLVQVPKSPLVSISLQRTPTSKRQH